MPAEAKEHIRKIVEAFWDIFDQIGLKRTMLGFEFAIDTGSHTPVCCMKAYYGANESKIIAKTIDTLFSNNFIILFYFNYYV